MWISADTAYITIQVESWNWPVINSNVKIIIRCFLYNFYRPQRSWGKVIFLKASVILLTGGGGTSHHPRADTPPPEHAVRYGQRAGGTHPTGMQSCFDIWFWFTQYWVLWDLVKLTCYLDFRQILDFWRTASNPLMYFQMVLLYMNFCLCVEYGSPKLEFCGIHWYLHFKYLCNGYNVRSHHT